MKQEVEKSAQEEKAKLDRQPMLFSPMKIIFIAAWLGLLTGLAESVFLVGWRQYFRQSVVNLSPHALWMAPVIEMFIFILLGALLALLAWFLPRFFKIQTVSFFLGLLSFLALLLLFPQIHIYVKWILAAGLAVQASRIISKHQNGFYQLVRRTTPLLIVVVIGFVLFTFIRERVTEGRALAKLPPAASNAPNVILITLDTVRAESLSLHGYERKTSPQLEKLAQEGAVFNQAIVTASWTLPSHGSMFTGRFYNELGTVGWTKALKTSHPMLAEELGRRGYESAGFAANIAYCTRTYGLNRGMIHYEDYPVSLGQMILSSSIGQEITNSSSIRRAIGYYNNLNAKSADVINDDFLNWLSSREKNRPFFAFLNYFDAHEPLLPPAPFNEQFGPIDSNGTIQFQTTGVDFTDKHEWSAEDLAKHRNAYDSSIAYLDDRLGVLFNKLAEQGILDNTIVIITSDHGESFGDHGLFGHGNSLYYETLWVPLLVRYPSRVPKGVRIEQPVSLRDLPATVLDLIGDTKGENPFPGKSLGRYWDKKTDESNSDSKQFILSEISGASWMEAWSPAAKGKTKSLVADRYHYIYNEDGSEELYNLKTDPKELHNLAQSAEEQKTIAEFRSQMKTISEMK